MKRVLLAGSALGVFGLGNAVLCGPALAADSIKLSLGGYLNTAVLVNIDDSGKHVSGSNRQPDLGHGHYSDGVFQDARIKFNGETTLDNGITAGVTAIMYAETKSTDQFRAVYGYMRGGFGELRFGAQDGALQSLCITPVGGTANFGAFSQYQVINNAFSGFSAGVCNGVASFRGAHSEEVQKLVYLTPNFSGFQLGLSWAPNGDKKSADQGVGDFHSGMPKVSDGEQRNIFDAYATYSHDFTGWSLSWGGGASITASSGGKNYPDDNKAQFYQTGFNLTLGQWSAGAAVEYYRNYTLATDAAGNTVSGQDAWVAGAGLAYSPDNIWTFGLQYSHAMLSGLTEADRDRDINTVALSSKYAMGTGINLEGTLQYVWANGDQGDQAHGDYHSFGIGIGTAFTF